MSMIADELPIPGSWRQTGGRVAKYGKNEVANSLAEKLSVSKAEAGRIVDAVLADLAQKLVQPGDSVGFQGFGTFGNTRRAARTGTKPGTGEKIAIPEKNVIKFKPSPALVAAANGA